MNRLLTINLFLCLTAVYAQTGFFDPDGYYFPQEPFSLQRIKIGIILISSVSYYNDGKPDYEHPKISDPEIALYAPNTKQIGKATGIILNRDTLFFRCAIAGNKTLEFAGTFLDKRGQYWNQNDVYPQKTVIMKGVISLIENGIVKEKKESKFTFWEGD